MREDTSLPKEQDDEVTGSLHSWLIEPLSADVSAAIDRLRRAEGVRHVAVMPDVHLAQDVCVGTVIAADGLLYPQAVGGDIGCGMLAVAFDAGADLLSNPSQAAKVLAAIQSAVPPVRRHRSRTMSEPDALRQSSLSHGALEALRRGEGALQLGTLGGGNHFVELQADEEGRLWLMIHSGSRAIGQAIRGHHMAKSRPAETGGGLRVLDAGTDAGRAYAADVLWARMYADANRQGMVEAVADVLTHSVGVRACFETSVSCDHNHVSQEVHFGRSLWVHRKGASPAGSEVAGVLPGSMGTLSFHVEGRGVAASLCSSAHGAGRAFSREQARKRVKGRDVLRQMQGIWFDYRLADQLRDESPTAYKDVRAVLRAQRDLVKVIRTLRPILVYKGP